MKAFFLAILPLLFASSLQAQLSLTEDEVVEYSKSIDVKMLDPSLPSERLEDWLRFGPPHAEFLRWQSSVTCDNKPDMDGDYPRCVRVAFGRGGQSGYFLVHIGTFQKGIIGPPKLYQGIGVQERVAFVQTGWTERLSGLSLLLDQPVVTAGVDDLYQAIVARHPMGIPKGADKTIIWPLLSQRLRQQLETAQDCQNDYSRQHPKTDLSPKPWWLHTGIFTGDSKRALPLSALVGKKEVGKTAPFEVYVNLTYATLPGFVPDHAAWTVIASVVPEENHFVVDDVRLFDGLHTEGPSHLLSETFTGCDGSKWTGAHVVKRDVTLPPPHYTDWNAVNALRGRAYMEETTFAKGIDVHQLDPLLPSQHLEDWLKTDALHLDHLDWRALRCNITEGRYGATPNPQGGLCAEVFFQRGNAFVEIKVSNRAKGVPGPPSLDYMKVNDKDERVKPYLVSDPNQPSDSDRLSDLPRLLNQEAAIDTVRNLYDVIVEHPVLGIPQGDDRNRIMPLLSASLRRQLQDAEACQEDYLRQSPASDGNQEPVWFNVGLFSGEGELAKPGAELVDRKEQKKDGSFDVNVWLSRKISSQSNSAASAWRNWHVSVAVIAEDGRFAIDNVRIFDGLLADSPSHLLTDSFAGCNGSRWLSVDGANH